MNNMNNMNNILFVSRNDIHKRYNMLKGSVIGIEGLVGVGKSTASRSLSILLNNNNLNAKYYPEYVNMPLLNLYLSDMKKYAFPFQMIMLQKRIEIYKRAMRFSSTGGIAIIDRCLMGDYAFSLMQYNKKYISEEEWSVYWSEITKNKLVSPDIILYLKCDAEIAYNRMKSRNIKSEVNTYTLKYFTDLQESYTKSMKALSEEGEDICYKLDWNDNKYIIDKSLNTNECILLLETIRNKIIGD